MNGITPPRKVTVATDPGEAMVSWQARERSSTSKEAIRQGAYQKARPLLIQRLRLTMYLSLASYAFFVAQDVIFFRDRLTPLLCLKVVQVAAVAASLWTLSRAWFAQRAVITGLALVAVLGALAVACSIVRGNTSSSVLLFVVATMGMGIGLPWGPRAQAGLVALYGGLLAWNHYAVDGTLMVALANPATAAVLTAALASVFAARVYEQYRWQAELQEGELRRSESALTAVIESTSDSVWSVDRERRIIIMNTAVREVFAELYDTAVASGDAFEQRAPPALLATWGPLYDRVLAGERVSTEQTFERHGILRHYLISMCPIREGHQVVGATVFSRDITELRQAAEMARRNQAELTHVLRLGTMGEIASALAHEINQPLGAISNYAGACGRWLESGAAPTAEWRRSLEQISAQALRAGEVVRRLRDLCRKGDGHMDVVDVNDVVRRAVQLMEPQVRLQGLSMEFAGEEPLPAVHVDPVQIEQVVLNLLLNAAEAMQGSDAKQLTVRTQRHGSGVLVAVRDTGPGFGANLPEQIFEPFFTTKTQGLGMGLAISRRIVEAHGGQLCGEPNRDGPGCTFSFTLPAAP